MSNQTKNKHLNCVIDPTFTNVNRLSYHLKMKMTELLFQNIMYQKFK